MSLQTREEREIVVRDKAAREGIEVPDAVVDYLVEKFDTPQALKAGLINIAMKAHQRGCAIDVPLAQLVIDGIRPVPPRATLGAEEVEAAAETLPLSELGEPLEVVEYEPLFDDEFDDGFDDAFDNAVEADPDPAREDTPVSADDGVIQETLDFGFGPTDFASAEPEPVPEPEPQPHPHPAPTAAPAPAPAADPVRDALPQSDISGDTPPATVYFMPLATKQRRSMLERITDALDRCGLPDIVRPGAPVAVKVHFGEAGNTAFVSPLYARAVVTRIKQLGGKPFLTDANTLYSGMRTNAVDHLECAIANGFGYSSVGAPIIIADGLISRDSVEVALNGTRHFDSVRISSAVHDADAMVVISHVKGHAEAGFGAAIKNVGMGLGCRSAKQRMHSGVKPRVDFAACRACGRCVTWCNYDAIDMRDDRNKPGRRHAFIDKHRCIGCGQCVAACAYEAIAVNWTSDPESFLERTVEHTAGVLAGFAAGQVCYLNFLTDISPDCDCWTFSDAPIVPDIGILASNDIVAIDRASIDLVESAVGAAGSRADGVGAGTEKFRAIHGVGPEHSATYAEQLGLGTCRYRLEEIG
ncbi:MAG: DUF362 domain-containing protein [Actinomycetes bacterium]|jgi:uncharacterized Fe-S center protein|nr:DUF362 domain-containing protein [Actinomycetes bacterium]